MTRSWAAHAAAIAVLFALPGRSSADPFHYQPVPLGERALGMGGAFTGVANEPSAAFYNPAGLVRLEDTTLSAGLTLSAFERLSVEDGFRTVAGQATLRHRSRPSLPLFVSLVKLLGPRDEARRRRHAVALSTFTLDQRRMAFDAKIEQRMPDGRTLIDTIQVQDEETTRWHGASYAYRVSDEISIGLSLFWSSMRGSHSEERVHFTLASGTPENGLDPTGRLDSRRSSQSVTSAVGRFGILYAKPRYRIGLMVQPPSVHLRGSASVRDRVVTLETADPSRGSYTEASDDDVRAEQPFPWEVRAGGSYEPTSDFMMAFDASFYGATGSASEPVRAIGGRQRTEEAGRAARLGALALERYQRDPVGNVSLGTEYLMYDAIVLRLGVFSDFSSAPRVPRTSSTYRPADIHRFGMAGSLGIVTAGYDVSLGAVARLGWGHAMALVGEEPTTSYRRSRADEHTLYVFLTGARSAVGRLAQKTMERLSAPPPVETVEPVPDEPPAPQVTPPPRPKPRK